MKFWVYILECADGTLYTGSTNDLARRLTEHGSSKKGARYTRTRRPIRLVYKEKYATLRQALRREAEIKRFRREKKLALINE